MRLATVRFTVWRLMIAVAVCALLSNLLVTWVIQPKMVAGWEQGCQANLRAIGLALQAYHADHGCYPPAYMADASGRPLHSWRVLILPYLGEPELFRAYRFDEPWDGPNNARLATWMPELYQCPAHPRSTTCTARGSPANRCTRMARTSSSPRSRSKHGGCSAAAEARCSGRC